LEIELLDEVKELSQATLGKFIARSDELGGPSSPECAKYWQGLQYTPTARLDKQCEPLSEEYKVQQMALYSEMTGHEYQEMEHEFTPGVPVDSLLEAPNAYGFMAPHEFARHCVAMGILVQRLGLSSDQLVLELGSGWGFCQEFLAATGVQSKGIDINPDFVCTSNQRLERLGFGSRTVLMPFGNIGPHLGLFDIVMSYEAFHHAVDPLSLLRSGVSCLKDRGRLVLAAEPFNAFYRTWGLRLDPYSVYCINKFGWFESGWSADYIAFLFAMVGLEAEFIDMPLSDLTRYMIGSQTGRIRPFQMGLWHPEVESSVIRDGDNFFTTGRTRVLIPKREGVKNAQLEVQNFSRKSLKVIVDGLGKAQTTEVPPGTSNLSIDLSAANEDGGTWFSLISETFCPAKQGINDDTRQLGVYVSALSYG